MTKYRPKRNFSRDQNHYIPVDVLKMIAGGVTRNDFGVWRGFLRGYNVELHDMSKSGGEFVDWMCIIHDKVFFIEIKVEREVVDKKRQKLSDEEYYYGQLTDGEKSFFDNTSAERRICATEQQVVDYMTEMVDLVDMTNGDK